MGTDRSSLSSSASYSSFASHLLFLLTIFPLNLACFAFVLPWRSGLNDPIIRWSTNHHEFLDMVRLGGLPVQASHSSGSDCVDLQGLLNCQFSGRKKKERSNYVVFFVRLAQGWRIKEVGEQKFQTQAQKQGGFRGDTKVRAINY